MTANTALRVILLTFLCCTITACEKPADKEARYLKHGNLLFEQQNFAKARLDYKNAAQIMPNDAEPRFRLGLVDEAEGDAQNAFASFLSAEQQNAHYHPALLKLANYFLAIGEYNEADHRLTIVLAEIPDDAEAHALRAALLLRRKEYDGAEKEARLALAKDPANLSATSVLTGLYAAEKNEAQAEQALEEGLKHNPGNMSLLLLRVTLLERSDDLEKITQAYRAVFAAKPDADIFRADLALIYLKHGKKPEAEAVLREGVAVMPGNWKMKKDLVDFLNKNTGIDAAEKEIHALIKAYPKNDDLYFWLADIYNTHGASDRAETLLEQIVEREQQDGTSLNARTSLARIHFVKGDRALADKLVAAVLAKDPGNQDALLIRAQMSFGFAHYQDAVSDLRSIIRDNPKAASALQLLAEIALIENHFDLAIDTQTQLVELDPANPSPAVRLAQMLLMNGNEKRALEILDNTTRLAPAYPVGWESLARADIAARNWEGAQAAIHTLGTLEGQHAMVLFLTGLLLDAQGKREQALPYYIQLFTAEPGSALGEHALSAFIAAKQALNQLQDAANILLALKTDNPFIATLIGGCFEKLHKLPEAAAQFDKAIAANVSSPDAYIGRARIYAQANADSAISLLKAAQEKFPSDIRAPALAASLLGKLGRYKDAITLYETILRQSPDNEPAANNMAQMIADYMYRDAASLDKARQTAERFAGSKEPLYLDTLGWVYFRQGNIQQAQIMMERARSLAHAALPPEVHYHYGSLLLTLGKTEEAKTELSAATAGGSDYAGLAEAQKLLSGL